LPSPPVQLTSAAVRSTPSGRGAVKIACDTIARNMMFMSSPARRRPALPCRRSALLPRRGSAVKSRPASASGQAGVSTRPVPAALNRPSSTEAPPPATRTELFFARTQVTRSPWRAAIRVFSADHEIHDLPWHVDELPHRLPGQARRDPIHGQRRRARVRLGGVAGELDASAHLAVHLDGELDHVVDREGLVPRWPGLVRER